jgi:hypothetical protein
VQLIEQVDVEVAELAAKVFAWLRHASSFVGPPAQRRVALDNLRPVAYFDPDPPRLGDQRARVVPAPSEFAILPLANNESALSCRSRIRRLNSRLSAKQRFRGATKQHLWEILLGG